MNPAELVYIDTRGLLGSNFYWHKYAAHGLTKEDILSAGLSDDRVQVSKQIIDLLVAVDKELQQKGMRLYLKEGYRSEQLYRTVYERRVQKYGKEQTDSLFNMADMPHAQGLSVDVALWDAQTNKEIFMRKGDDGAPALFINFYRDKQDPESKQYQDLQDYLAELMQKHGFRIGTRREYFHFDYRPDSPPNYP